MAVTDTQHTPISRTTCHGLMAPIAGTLLDVSSPRRQSALNLRLLLTLFGLAFTIVLMVLAILFQNVLLGVFAAVLGVVTIVDLVVISIRIRRRRQREPGAHHSIFQ